jgi:hypothetical protein
LPAAFLLPSAPAFSSSNATARKTFKLSQFANIFCDELEVCVIPSADRYRAITQDAAHVRVDAPKFPRSAEASLLGRHRSVKNGYLLIIEEQIGPIPPNFLLPRSSPNISSEKLTSRRQPWFTPAIAPTAELVPRAGSIPNSPLYRMRSSRLRKPSREAVFAYHRHGMAAAALAHVSRHIAGDCWLNRDGDKPKATGEGSGRSDHRAKVRADS